MKSALDLLIAATEEQRPIVLLLGQHAWTGSDGKDPVLLKALERLGRSGELRRGWSALLGNDPLPDTFYEWLAERFERRVHPAWLTVLGDLPWSAVFTSSLDPTLKKVVDGPGRESGVVLTARETPAAVRSKARPPLYYLFSHASSFDQQALPPKDRGELNTRRVRHALQLLNRVIDTATSLGIVVIDGFVPGCDWIRIGDVLGAIGTAGPEQILWFGGKPDLSAEDEADFDAAVASGRILVERDRLGTVVAELRALGRLPDLTSPDSEEAGIVSFKGGRLETTPEERLQVEAVASLVDDAWTAFLPPLGPDAEYDAFRRFHGDLGGPRLLVEGVRRGFAIERDFERTLWRQMTTALANPSSVETPIIVHGQSGTGKSVALARIVVRVREQKTAAVLYAIGRVPQPQDVSTFCAAAEKGGAEATLIVCDANRDIDHYRDLLMSLRSRGRRIVVLGSRYRLANNISPSPSIIEATSQLSESERKDVADLLTYFFPEKLDPDTFVDSNILAFLYRSLPSSRPRIGAGLSAEATATVETLQVRGRQPRPVFLNTQLAEQLNKVGLTGDPKPLFDEQQNDALNAEDAAGRIVDLVMVAGSLDCPIPVNLLLRAVTEAHPEIDSTLIATMFSALDLFRWKWADEERRELLVWPRLTLEAELICRRRLNSPEREAECLIELISSIRSNEIDGGSERQFLISLLQQMGDEGPRGSRYQHSYVAVARTLTKLRQQYGVSHPSLILQESAFRRSAVRKNIVDEGDRLLLLEEARDAIQAALDGIANGTMSAARRTRQNLLVERASLYGFLAYDRAKREGSSEEIWSSYQAAREAIHRATNVTGDYYPFDVGLWTPSDLLKMVDLSEARRAELRTDIYSTLDQIDPKILPPKQRERFASRKMQVGQRLQDLSLTEDAYAALERSGSTAGYFLRARELAPDLDPDIIKFSLPEDIAQAKCAADFLSARFDKIEHDERCLWLLLECRWIAEIGRRPLRGQRQPLPVADDTRRDLLKTVRALNQASGDASRHVTRYLEAVLTWVIGDRQTAIPIFQALSQETDYEDPSRVFRRHLLTGTDLKPRSFEGRIERQRSEGHWVVRVDGLNQTIDLLSRDFEHHELAYGRSVRNFSIAFNFIGPIADPIR